MEDMEVVFGSLAAQNERRSFSNASPVDFWIGDLRNSRTEGISNETIESKDGRAEAWRIDCLMDKIVSGAGNTSKCPVLEFLNTRKIPKMYLFEIITAFCWVMWKKWCNLFRWHGPSYSTFLLGDLSYPILGWSILSGFAFLPNSLKSIF